jgi:hypothetical protein
MRPTKESISCSFIFSFLANSANTSSFIVARIVGDSSFERVADMVALVSFASCSKLFSY